MSSWEELEQVVSARVLDDARRVSATLTELGVPHALVGGLAVGLHGHPRATKDVDFLVGAEAFASTEPLLTFRDELAQVVQWGVIDLIGRALTSLMTPTQDSLPATTFTMRSRRDRFSTRSWLPLQVVRRRVVWPLLAQVLLACGEGDEVCEAQLALLPGGA